MVGPQTVMALELHTVISKQSQLLATCRFMLIGAQLITPLLTTPTTQLAPLQLKKLELLAKPLQLQQQLGLPELVTALVVGQMAQLLLQQTLLTQLLAAMWF